MRFLSNYDIIFIVRDLIKTKIGENMRCPKCGAFLEEEAKHCFMCGLDLNADNKGETNTNTDNGFFTANENRSFDNQSYQEDYLKKKEAYENRMNNYRDVPLEVKKGDGDIIDFYLQHKKAIHIILLVFVFLGLLFGGYKLYQNRNTEVKHQALFGDLYYEIHASFVAIESTNTSITYSKSGEKGSDCAVTLRYGSSTSGNHVEDYFGESLKKLEPSTDREGNILDELELFTTTRNELDIHDMKWYQLNVYYRPSLEVIQYSVLRNIYLSKVYNGFYYDIELVNHANTSFCNAELDSFMKSLEFIEK